MSNSRSLSFSFLSAVWDLALPTNFLTNPLMVALYLSAFFLRQVLHPKYWFFLKLPIGRNSLQTWHVFSVPSSDTVSTYFFLGIPFKDRLFLAVSTRPLKLSRSIARSISSG